MFTEAVLEMPGSQIWAILFFIMLFSLGLSSMFGNIEGILTPINDLKLIPKWFPSELVTGTYGISAEVILNVHLISVFEIFFPHFFRNNLPDILLVGPDLHPGFRKLLGGGL